MWGHRSRERPNPPLPEVRRRPLRCALWRGHRTSIARRIGRSPRNGSSVKMTVWSRAAALLALAAYPASSGAPLLRPLSATPHTQPPPVRHRRLVQHIRLAHRIGIALWIIMDHQSTSFVAHLHRTSEVNSAMAVPAPRRCLRAALPPRRCPHALTPDLTRAPTRCPTRRALNAPTRCPT